jgi:MFS family permease
MFRSLSRIYHEYPRQYWLMITGIVISTAGGSMIWPFMLIYASSRLNLPLSTVATLISINAGTGLFASFLAGWVADHIGRKVVMNFSLTINGLAYFFMMGANTYAEFALLMVMIGLSNPLYQVGADAMLADMIPSEKRTDAYAINRIANNAAFGIGPALGGFLAARSYNLTFYGAAAGFLIYSLLLFVLARETLNKKNDPAESGLSAQARYPAVPKSAHEIQSQPQGGYGEAFRDAPFMTFMAATSLGLVAPTLVWILMPVYTKTNFGLSEALYGWIPTTNALMCVFIQFPVTRLTRRYKALPVLAAGMLIYALGSGSVGLMSSFWGFWLSMVILTLGELTLVPTASKYVADRAPAHLRGRYMSIYWFGWGLARAISPLVGGFLNDTVTPRAIWVGGLLFGLASALGLTLLARRENPGDPALSPSVSRD